jgi:hypothetical protein
MFIIPWCRQPSTMILFPCNHSSHGTSLMYNLVWSMVWYLVKYFLHFMTTCENVLKHIFALYVTFLCSSRYTYNTISNVLLSLLLSHFDVVEPVLYHSMLLYFVCIAISRIVNFGIETILNNFWHPIWNLFKKAWNRNFLFVLMVHDINIPSTGKLYSCLWKCAITYRDSFCSSVS